MSRPLKETNSGLSSKTTRQNGTMRTWLMMNTFGAMTGVRCWPDATAVDWTNEVPSSSDAAIVFSRAMEMGKNGGRHKAPAIIASTASY